MTSFAKERLLRMLGQRARTLRCFTHMPRLVTEQTSANVLEMLVLDLCLEGLAEFKENKFHITQAGKETLEALGYFGNPAPRITEQGAYVGEKWNLRPGSQDFLKCPSIGLG